MTALAGREVDRRLPCRPARGDEQSAVGAERQPIDLLGLADGDGERQLLPGFDVPDLDLPHPVVGVPVARQGEPLAPRVEGHTEDRLLVARQAPE